MSDFFAGARNPFQVLLTRLFPPLAFLSGCDDEGASAATGSDGGTDVDTDSDVDTDTDTDTDTDIDTDTDTDTDTDIDTDTDTDVDTDTYTDTGTATDTGIDTDTSTGTNIDTDLDTDTGTDTDTYTECTLNAYQQCGTDGNVHWFDSCDVEGAEVDDCDDACETCENTSDTTAECQAAVLADVQSIAAGNWHTCAVLTSGGAMCWGFNEYGQIGNGISGPDEYETTPVGVLDLTSGVQATAGGRYHTCALLTSGGIKCWGSNEYGQLGDGTLEDSTTLVDVVGLTSNAQAISADRYHTCALLDSGGVMCWGGNEYGQLGDGTTVDKNIPTDVFGLTSGVQAIAVGRYHTCAVLDSGGAMCWGSNEYGQLGDGTLEDSATPVDVVDLASGVQTIAAAGRHSCAVLTSGGMECWGDNYWGQLGDGTTDDSLTPVDVVDLTSNVQAIASGELHTCALLTSGGMECWGRNNGGQLGVGTTVDKHIPTAVLGLSFGAQAVTASNYHTCALLDSGGVVCWGSNAYGQLGNGIGGIGEYETMLVDVCPGL